MLCCPAAAHQGCLTCQSLSHLCCCMPAQHDAAVQLKPAIFLLFAVYSEWSDSKARQGAPGPSVPGDDLISLDSPVHSVSQPLCSQAAVAAIPPDNPTSHWPALSSDDAVASLAGPLSFPSAEAASAGGEGGWAKLHPTDAPGCQAAAVCKFSTYPSNPGAFGEPRTQSRPGDGPADTGDALGHLGLSPPAGKAHEPAQTSTWLTPMTGDLLGDFSSSAASSLSAARIGMLLKSARMSDLPDDIREENEIKTRRHLFIYAIPLCRDQLIYLPVSVHACQQQPVKTMPVGPLA